MIRLAIADDHQSLIDGIQLHLKYEEDIKFVGTANDGEALLELVRLKKPNVVIVDIRMPKIDGIQATKKIKKDLSDTKVLAFTMFDQDDAVSQMLNAGADGYILKNASLKELLKAIRKIYKGKNYYDPQVNISEKENHDEQRSTHLLTHRQTEILRLIGQGKTSREIADELCIGVYTVDTHRKNMARILGLHGKGELMRYALQRKYDF